MLGETIGQRAIGDAGKRTLPTEQVGPRPAGARPDATDVAAGEARTAQATKP